MTKSKLCVSCSKVKDLAEFNKNKNRSDGVAFYCRNCAKGKQSRSYIKHHAKRKAEASAWYRANKKKAHHNKKEWKRKNKSKVYFYQINHLYGLTEAEYLKIKQKQNGACGICRAKEESARLDVDHDHNTGHVRGLLCNRCNTSIGRLGDTAESVMKAVKYLKQSEKDYKKCLKTKKKN